MGSDHRIFKGILVVSKKGKLRHHRAFVENFGLPFEGDIRLCRKCGVGHVEKTTLGALLFATQAFAENALKSEEGGTSAHGGIKRIEVMGSAMFQHTTESSMVVLVTDASLPIPIGKHLTEYLCKKSDISTAKACESSIVQGLSSVASCVPEGIFAQLLPECSAVLLLHIDQAIPKRKSSLLFCCGASEDTEIPYSYFSDDGPRPPPSMIDFGAGLRSCAVSRCQAVFAERVLEAFRCDTTVCVVSFKRKRSGIEWLVSVVQPWIDTMAEARRIVSPPF